MTNDQLPAWRGGVIDNAEAERERINHGTAIINLARWAAGDYLIPLLPDDVPLTHALINRTLFVRPGAPR